MRRTKFDTDSVIELLKKNLEFENMPKARLQQIAKVFNIIIIIYKHCIESNLC